MHTLALPSSLVSQPHDSFLRSSIPRHSPLQAAGLPLAPALTGLEPTRTEHIIARRRILRSAQVAERAFIAEIVDVNPYRATAPRPSSSLRKISLIRQIHEEDRAEYCVEYHLTPNSPHYVPRITRPCGREVRVPSASTATPSPLPSSASTPTIHHTLMDWERATNSGGKSSFLNYGDLCPSGMPLVAVREVRHYAPVEI